MTAPETIAESSFLVSINPSSEFSTSTFFNKVHAVSLDRSTTDNNWVLVLELSSKTLRITEQNRFSFSLVIEHNHPLLELIPPSSLGTPLYLSHYLTLPETHQRLIAAFPQLPESSIVAWDRPFVFLPPTLEWPHYDQPNTPTEFCLSYDTHSYLPYQKLNQGPSTFYISYDSHLPEEDAATSSSTSC